MFDPLYLSAHGPLGPSGADAPYGDDAPAGTKPTWTERAAQYQQNIQATSDLVQGVRGFVGGLRGKKAKKGTSSYAQKGGFKNLLPAGVFQSAATTVASLPAGAVPATTAGGTETGEEKSNTLLYVGGGLALLAVIGAGIYFAKKR